MPKKIPATPTDPTAEPAKPVEEAVELQIIEEPATKSSPRSAFSVEVRKAINAPDAIEIEQLDPVTAAQVADQQTDTELKRIYAYWMLIILGLQLAAMNVIFVLVGADVLKYGDPAYLKMFMGGTLAEVFGVVLVITRYLFSKNTPTSPKLKLPQLPGRKR